MTEPLSPTEFLTPAESLAVDQALLTTRDKFLTRVAIYSLRSLKQISQSTGLAIEDISNQQVADWIEHDESLQQEAQNSTSFKGFFTQLVLSSLKPLRQAAQEQSVGGDTQSAIANLTVAQVIAWFEKDASDRLKQSDGSTSLKD
jgi:hypothetical protein